MIQERLQIAGIAPLSPEVLVKFQTYLDLLLKWNARLNLTAIRDAEGMVQRHFGESIFAAQHLPAGTRTLLDFGSGGGFPGVPIALCRPEIRVVLAESQSRKAAFLREAARTLSLKNAQIFAGRVEALDRQFDAVTLRAVDKMEEACRIATGRIAPGGWMVPFTTKDAAEDLKTLLPEIAWESPLVLPGSEQRILLIGRKVSVPRGTLCPAPHP
jgi:16S rRNA (guanine527-N7)-methyltransferase